HATFVERDRAARDAIEANLTTTGLADQATIIPADATAFAQPVDLAFVDPPYSFDGWPTLLDVLDARVAVLESNREIEVGPNWLVNKVRRYGTTVVMLMQPKIDK